MHASRQWSIWLFCASLCGCGLNPTGEPLPKAQVRPSVPHVEQSESREEAIRSPQPDDWFAELPAVSNISFAYHNGRDAGRFLMIESFGGGVALVDFDRDDDVDLFVSGGGEISRDEPLVIGGLPCGLLRNAGELRFADVAAIAGLAGPIDYSQGCAVTDFNADGFPDLFVCCYGRSRLFCNMSDGTFSESDAAQLPLSGWATAAAFGDVDRDGLPDLMLGRYTEWTPERDVVCYDANHRRDLCGPTSYPGTSCQLWHNAGDGSFEDWSGRAGMQGGVHALGVAVCDLNDDGLVDFYVASDALPNQLYLGAKEGTLRECGVEAGVAVGEWGQPEGSMGIGIGDYDGDGAPDLFVTNFENEDNSLYRNLGNSQWAHRSVAAGLAGVSRRRVGFGTMLVDFDLDGWEDLFVLNGNPIYETAETPYRQQPQFFRNAAGGRFEEISDQAGPYFSETHSGRGCAAGDLNDDGAADLVLVLMNEPIRILANRKQPRDFIRVELHARLGEREATGAKVSCRYRGRTLVRWVTKGTSFFSDGDPRIVFPAENEASEVDVRVQWPSGASEAFLGLAVRRSHSLVEGRGARLP